MVFLILKTRYPWYWVKNVGTLDMGYDIWMLVADAAW
jgi:hypothetical protein